MQKLCGRVNLSNPLYIEYHNNERGKLIKEDPKLFELLILEGAQAGLSREIVLNKRTTYQKVFFDYDIEKIAGLSDAYLLSLMNNPNLIRNRLKLFSVRQNAKIFLALSKKHGGFYQYLCQFTKGQVFNNAVTDYKLLPTSNQLSEQISKDLKKTRNELRRTKDYLCLPPSNRYHQGSGKYLCFQKHLDHKFFFLGNQIFLFFIIFSLSCII